MKNLHLTILFVCVGIICSCSQEDDSILKEKSNNISLIAPNGDAIASTLTDLEKEITPIISEYSEIDENIEISKIQYASIKMGYIATIYYMTPDGKEKVIIKTNGVPFSIKMGDTIKEVKRNKRVHTRTENKAELNGMYIICSHPSPKCECIPTFTTRNDGGVSYTCNKYCKDCNAEVRSKK